MDYQLAVELKKAGFPQDHDRPAEDWTTMPTLSELIEACGEDFASLHKIPEGWVTYSTIKKDIRIEIASSDPSICVARLWLTIHTPKPEQS